MICKSYDTLGTQYYLQTDHASNASCNFLNCSGVNNSTFRQSDWYWRQYFQCWDRNTVQWMTDGLILWHSSLLYAWEFAQPEWKLLSHFETRILVVAKLKLAVPEWSAERNLVTEAKAIKWASKIWEFDFHGQTVLVASLLVGKYFCGKMSHINKLMRLQLDAKGPVQEGLRFWLLQESRWSASACTYAAALRQQTDRKR